MINEEKDVKLKQTYIALVFPHHVVSFALGLRMITSLLYSE